MTATLAPFVGAPVPHVPNAELADEPVVGLPASPWAAQYRADIAAGYSELRALASRISTVQDAQAAFNQAAGIETDVRNAHGVICYRLVSMGLTAKEAGAKLPRKLSEESVRNRASLGEAIVRHLASEGEADVIARGINRPHQRAEVRSRLSAEDCDIPQLCAWIESTRKAPAKSAEAVEASEDNGSESAESPASDPAAVWAGLAEALNLAALAIASGETPTDYPGACDVFDAAMAYIAAVESVTA